MALQDYVARIVERRETLSRTDARNLLEEILAADTTGNSSNALHLAAILSSFALRGETPAEIAGFVDAMRAAATPVPLTDAERAQLVDTCGTGADLSGTFNISTAAALVAAAAGASTEAGILVAKHGNRAVTSQSGSADVLEALGIPIGLSPTAGAAALRRHRFAFLHAPSLHPAMKAVMPVRRALGIRTIFHLVGPLSNPAGARAQVLGVYSAPLVPLVAEAMRLLGTRHAFVVHGALESSAETTVPRHSTSVPPSHSVNSSLNLESGSSTSPNPTVGLDEISISGPTQIAEVKGSEIVYSSLTPEQVGLANAPIESLRGGDATTNAAILRAVFAGERGPRRDVVLLNAAAVLLAADVIPYGVTEDIHTAFRAAIALAARAIDAGSVTRLIAALAADVLPLPSQTLR